MFRRGTSVDSSSEVPLVGTDRERICDECGYVVSTSLLIVRVPRTVMLHTLHHGSFNVEVIDLKCNVCGKLIPYDGVYDALFSTRKEHLFTRELLDAWLWDVCGTGGTFRDAFYSWSSKNCMSSAACHRIGDVSTFARQRGNEAFSAFLMTLKFPKERGIFDLFSCSKCERTLEDGSKRMDGVLMDGSAIGIIGKLSNFKHVTHLMNVVPRISDRQHVYFEVTKVY